MRAAFSVARRLAKIPATFRWLPAYLAQRTFMKPQIAKPFHLVMALADHFEPYILPQNPNAVLSQKDQLSRVQDWCERYRRLFQSHRDSCGMPFRHTYFYAAEHS